MATIYHNLSEYDFNSVPDATNMRFGIVVSEWNDNITGALLDGAVKTLKRHGAKDENILIESVPGSFELTFGAAQMIKSGKVDAVIALGCVVRGDTPHFDYVCAGATQGIAHLNATTDTPVITASSPQIICNKPKIVPAESWAIKATNAQLRQ